MPEDASQSAPLVTMERLDNGVAVITLCHGKVNALSSAVLDQFADIIDRLRADLPGAVVVTGGPKLFAAGADITEFDGPDQARRVGARFRRATDSLSKFPRMTIAAVNGVALGGGCELALACDLRIASSRARFGQPEILLGIIPGGGGTQRLARLVGASRAKDLVLTGRQIEVDEAYRIGLVDEIVEVDAERDAVTERALALAAELAAGPLAAQALAKQAIDGGLATTLDEGMTLEQNLFVESFRTEDAVVGVASFLEHGPGKASFVGR